MLFVLITFFSAFLIESIGTYVSVVGLSALFSSNPVIIMLAIALDIGKIVTVSFLYKHWKKLNLIMKTYMLVAAASLMVITSTGAAGYLAAEFQKAIVSTKESDIRVSALKEEKVKLETRKKEIDKQIANLPQNMVRGRTKLIAEFKNELDQTNSRLIEIDKELPELEVSKAHGDSHAGPILYIAKAFNITVEEAVKWVILLIIFVFDPLAVVLIIGGNFLLDYNKEEKERKRKEQEEREDHEREHKYKIELEELKHKFELEEERNEIEKLHIPSALLSKNAEELQLEKAQIGETSASVYPVTEEEFLVKDDEEIKHRGQEGTEITKAQEEVVEEPVEIIEPEPMISTEEQPEEQPEEPEPAISTEEQLDDVVSHAIHNSDAQSSVSTSLSLVDAAKADVVLAQSPSTSLKNYIQ